MVELDASRPSTHPVDSREWLDAVLCSRCKVSKLWPYQLDLGMEINQGMDVYLTNATGMGKTVLLQAGAIAADARGGKRDLLDHRAHQSPCGAAGTSNSTLSMQSMYSMLLQAEVASRRGLRTRFGVLGGAVPGPKRGEESPDVRSQGSGCSDIMRDATVWRDAAAYGQKDWDSQINDCRRPNHPTDESLTYPPLKP
ncbi:hypothetical protein C8R47DRAFT_751280 [Mycena vitilis]|nr:hypothetical protein C8R47DRAFT_751280 [Mycena vitilis]